MSLKLFQFLRFRLLVHRVVSTVLEQLSLLPRMELFIVGKKVDRMFTSLMVLRQVLLRLQQQQQQLLLQLLQRRRRLFLPVQVILSFTKVHSILILARISTAWLRTARTYSLERTIVLFLGITYLAQRSLLQARILLSLSVVGVTGASRLIRLALMCITLAKTLGRFSKLRPLTSPSTSKCRLRRAPLIRTPSGSSLLTRSLSSLVHPA
jgi:hypothetical protein